MPAFKPEQRHLNVRGRAFHFVSYEGHAADPKRGRALTPAMWYLMVEGRRCPVIPYEPGQSAPDLDAALLGWVEDNALGPVVPATVASQPKPNALKRRYENWWGAN